jgi:hypothetical protein
MQILKTLIYSLIILSIFSALIVGDKLKNTIKWLFSLIFTVILVSSIISTVSNLNSEQKNIVKIDNNYYITNALISKTEFNEKTFNDYLNNIGIQNAKINTRYELLNNKINYKIIQIDLKNAVINNNKSHIDIQNEISSFAKLIFGKEIIVEFL